MKSIVNLQILGEENALRSRALNVGTNAWFSADVLNGSKFKSKYLILIKSMNALILSPYIDNLSVYNMAEKDPRDLNLTYHRWFVKSGDWRKLYTIPHGWIFESESLLLGGPDGPKIAFATGVNQFVPGGKCYHGEEGPHAEASEVEFKEWQDWWYKPFSTRVVLNKETFKGMYPDGIRKTSPIFHIGGKEYGKGDLIYWHQINNIIDNTMFDDEEHEDTQNPALSVGRWVARSYDPDSEQDKPIENKKSCESSGTGITNFLKSDQGVFLSYIRPSEIISKNLKYFMDNIYEFRLNWVGGDGTTQHEIKFMFNVANHLNVEFSKIPLNSETGVLDYPNTEKIIKPVQYKNNIKNEKVISMFILFLDGNIVILNERNEEVATIKVPDFMITHKLDVNNRVYGSITGEKTKIRFSGYGECYFLISPVLFENAGFLDSAELKNGERLSTIVTEFESVIPEPLGPGNIIIVTETGPNLGEMDPDDIEANDIVRRESWYKFSIMLTGDLNVEGIDHEYLMSFVTPILYNMGLISSAVKLPREQDKIPDAGEISINLDGLNFSKSVDENGEYTSGQLELSYDIYNDVAGDLDINVPFLLRIGSKDSQKNDYSGNYTSLTEGVKYVDVEEYFMGLFLVNNLGYTRTNANVFEKKLSINCSDLIKKLTSTFITSKVTFVGKKNVDAITDLVNMAYLGERLYVPEDSLIKSAEGFSLPAFPDGGRQWIFEIGDTIWDCMQKIRSFYGWALYIDNNGMIVYKAYDRSSLNRSQMIENAKYIFVPNYNWTESGVIGLDKNIIPISEYSKFDVDTYRTRIQVVGINGTRQKLYDSYLGKEVIAEIGDKVSCLIINKELEEKLGETRIGIFEDLTLTTISSIKQTAKCIARQMFRKRTTISFKVLVGEFILDLDLYNPILVYEDGQQILYEVISISYQVRPYGIEFDIEARDVP